MKTISRRKFLKGALTVIAMLPVASMFVSKPDAQKGVTLKVDKDGNAVLLGAAITVDKNNKATVM
jgi:hypothetical protein